MQLPVRLLMRSEHENTPAFKVKAGVQRASSLTRETRSD